MTPRMLLKKMIKHREKNKSDIEEQISKTIQKQIKEMKTSVISFFYKLEKYLLKEAKGQAASLEDYPIDSEINKSQSLYETINEMNALLSSVHQNGTNVHQYIAAKNTEKELVTIDSSLRKANTLHLKSLYFSFDKMLLLQNVHVAINTVTKSLADIDGNIHESSRPRVEPRKKRRAMAQDTSNTFAILSAKTTTVDAQVYPYRQLDVWSSNDDSYEYDDASILPSFDTHSEENQEEREEKQEDFIYTRGSRLFLEKETAEEEDDTD